MSFDPTFGVPSAPDSWTGRLMGPELLAAVGAAVREAIPEPVKRAVGAAGRAVATGVGALVGAWPVVLAMVLLGGLAFVAARRRRRARPRGPTDEIGRAFEEVVAALAPLGHPREPSATPSEYLAALDADPALAGDIRDDAETVIRLLERARFAPPDARPPAQERTRAGVAARSVRERVAHR
jgi:hypothetical protein